MTQEYAQPNRSSATTSAPSVLDELEKRRQEREADAEAEQRRKAELEAVRNDIATGEKEVQDRIDALLSASPEEFVMRFIQTEGQ